MKSITIAFLMTFLSSVMLSAIERNDIHISEDSGMTTITVYSSLLNSYCPMCGEENYDQLERCASCGHGIDHPSVGSGEVSAPIKDHLLLIFLFCLLYFLICLIKETTKRAK